MNRPVLMRLALGVGVLVMMTLSLTGCGSGVGSAQEEQAKASPLPEAHQDLRPGEYRTEEFKPSASFNVREVYKPILKPTQTSMPEVMKVPDDLAAWLQHHPYLKTGKPEPITLGGVKGVEFDVVAEAPEEHTS